MKTKKKIKSNIAIFNILLLKKKIRKSKRYFFFPFFHVGGAERVHIDIMNVFNKEENLCFITNTSKDNSFKNEFLACANLLYLGKLIKRPFKKIVIKSIANEINKQSTPVVFGSNNDFFYQLIPNLKSHVLVIDLVHAFADRGIEVRSLPVVSRIDKRVVLGNKTYQDFKKLYEEFNVDSGLLKNINIIRNKVLLPEFNITKEEDVLNILFVGRDSEEKRFHLFLLIANYFKENKKLKFIVIGPFVKEKYNYSSNISL